jgi:hypothetical protein
VAFAGARVGRALVAQVAARTPDAEVTVEEDVVGGVGLVVAADPGQATSLTHVSRRPRPGYARPMSERDSSPPPPPPGEPEPPTEEELDLEGPNESAPGSNPQPDEEADEHG